MIVDSGGSVYEMRTHTRVRVRRVKCVFSGCHGEVIYCLYFFHEEPFVI